MENYVKRVIRMKIKTITCHDVYNAGASLQAYALSEYLLQQGHDVEIIDYKPDYLSKRYNFKAIDNPKYENFLIFKIIYIILKFPKRLLEHSGKKKFDKFREDYLRLTVRYCSLEELKQNPPLANLYIAGSDQIWNTLFQNGKDGAFYLAFAPKGTKKASYAASFSTETIAHEWKNRVKDWLSDFDNISVREKSAVKLLDEIGIKGQVVLDPVFLLTEEQWKKMIKNKKPSKKIFVYDFDRNNFMKEISLIAKEKLEAKIISFFKVDYSDENLKYPGPLEFLEVIYNSELIISNSFHATVFSLIFHKEFFVVKRNENINLRMMDLLKLVGLEDRMISTEKEFELVEPIDWGKVDQVLKEERDKSIEYLMEITKENENS